MIVGALEIQLRADIARLQRDMDDARRVVGGAVDGIARAAGAARTALAGMAAGLSLGALAHQVIDAQREFDKLNSSLITATGSTANAAQAFKALQSFAATTPYSVQEATEAFIKLRNLGLDPSEKAMRSYGNTASSMSKGLNQMIEAVADAANGQFERLNEFGIKTQQNGAQVSLTFKGVTSNIGNNAAEIQAYLQKLGETDFAGAMERRAATLDGAISNLGDTWAGVMRDVAQNGVGEAAKTGVTQLGGALNDLGAILDVVAGKAKNEGKAVSDAGALHSILTTVFETISVLGVNVAYVFEQVGKEIAGLAAQAEAVLHGEFSRAGAIGDMMKKDAEEARKAVDAKSEAILHASKQAQDARDAETANLQKNGTDQLSQYQVQLSAEEKRKNALNALVDVRKKLLGIDQQDAADMKKIQTALDTGAISQAEYNRLKGQLEKQMQANSLAYKQEQKNLDAQVASIQRATEALGLLNQRQQEHIQFLKNTGQINDEAAINKGADAQIQNLNDQITAQEKLRAIASKRQDSQAAVKAIDGQIANMRTQIDNAQTKRDEDLFQLEQQRYRAAVGNTADLIEAAQAEAKAQQDRTRDQQDEIEALGLTGQQLAKLTAARLRDQAVALDRRAEISMIDEVTDALHRQAEELRKQADQVLVKEEVARQKEIWSSIEQTAHDTFISIFDSGKSAFDRLRDALKNGLLDLLYQMTLKQWIINIGTSVGVSGATGLVQAGSSVVGANGAPGMSSAIGAVQAASSIYKAITNGFASLSDMVAGGVQSAMSAFGYTPLASQGLATASGQALTPFASAAGSAAGYGAGVLGGHYIGNAIAGDYSVSHGQTVTNVASVVGAVLGGPIGGAIGGAIGGVINRAFGMGSKEITSQGIRGTLSADSLTGESYADWVKKGGWFRSTQRDTDRTPFSDAYVKQFTQGLAAIETASSGFASALGVQADWIKDYSRTFDLKLTGDQSKDAQTITDFFVGIGNDLAKKLVPNLDELSKSGETASAALERLANDFKGTDQVAQLLGTSAAAMFGSAGLGSAGAREQLIDAAGGLQALAQQAQIFGQNFLTDAERLAPVSAALDKALAGLGLSTIPETRHQFKGLVQDLIASGAAATEQGSKQLASLLALGEAFAQVHPQIDAAAAAAETAATAFQSMKDAASTLLSGIDSAYSVLEKVVNRQKSAVQATVAAHSAAVTELQSLSQALHGAISGMQSPDQLQAARTDGQAQIRAALAAARAGGALPDADSLKDALSAVQKDASDQFSSYTDYLRDLYSTQADIGALAGITDDQLSVEQRALQAAQDQLKALDGILEREQALVDEAKGQSTTLLSIDQGIAALHTAILAAQQNPIVAATSGISTAYQQYLGRAPDAGGLDYYQKLAAGGTSIDAIRDGIASSAEAQIQKLYGEVFNRPADAGGLKYYMDDLAKGYSLDDIRSGLMQSDEYKKLHQIPGFAEGGDHGGGLRWVGELGPEIEATGASRIHSTQSLIDSLRNPSDNSAVLAAAVQRLSGIVETQGAVLDQIQRNTRRQADTLETVTEGGSAMRTKEQTP